MDTMLILDVSRLKIQACVVVSNAAACKDRWAGPI